MKSGILYSLLLVIVLCQTACNINGNCSNHVYKEISSMNGDLKIIKFDRGCGSTVDNSIQLSVIKIEGELPNTSGNIFISNSKVGSYIERDTSVQVTWINDTTVLIKHDKDLEIFKKDTLVNNVKIIYKLK